MKTQLQHHLKEGLTSLLEAQELNACLTVEQAMSLFKAATTIESIIKELDRENQSIARADVAVADMLLKACN